MPAQQLHLCWKDHNGALVSVFENLLKNETLVDCTLAAEGQYLKAHKVVLSACSSYFELLFSQESEKNPIVILKDVKFQELEAAVSFMYRGEVEVCEDRLPAFLEVANSLQVKGLGSDGKLQDSKENVLPVISSRAKSALTQRQQSRTDDSNPQSDNFNQSSNVHVDNEEIRNDESSSGHQLSRRGSSSACTDSTFSVRSSCTNSKKTSRDSDCLENNQQSLVLSSFTSSESVECEGNPIIKIEPEIETFVEDQSDEEERSFGDDVTTMDDQVDWNKPNTLDAAPSNQQIGYPSEQMKAEDSTCDNVDGMHLDNRSSLEDAGWILPDGQQNFSSVFVKEPETSASWDREVVSYRVSTRGDVAEPSAGTSAASAGVDNLLEYHAQPTPAAVQFYPRVAESRSIASGKSANALWQGTTPQPSSKKLSCPSCKKFFVRMINLEKHQCCSTLPCDSEDGLLLDDTSLSQTNILKKDRKSLKCSSFKCPECNYVTPKLYILKKHLLIHRRKKLLKCPPFHYASGTESHLLVHLGSHIREKPFKCSQCEYASERKDSLLRHLIIHTGEKPFLCQHCNYACNMRSNLIKHQRRHTREKTF